MDWHTQAVEPGLSFPTEWISLMGSLSPNEISPFSEFLRHQTCATKGLNDQRGEFPQLRQLVWGDNENLAGGWALPHMSVSAPVFLQAQLVLAWPCALPVGNHQGAVCICMALVLLKQG